MQLYLAHWIGRHDQLLKLDDFFYTYDPEILRVNVENIINQASAMGVCMEVISAMLTAEIMKNAFNATLVNSTKNNTQPIAAQIDQFMATFETVRVGDVWEFIYLPKSGFHVLLNSKYRDIVAGLEFKKSLFEVWLSDHPAQENLNKIFWVTRKL